MQKYRIQTPLAALSNRILRIAVTSALGVGWFVFLWGLCLPALTAGLALGALLWLCTRQFSRQITRRREAQLRRMIGGELALDKLLLEQPRKAAFECALWLAPCYPLIVQEAADWRVNGILNGQKTCIRLIAQHPAQPVQVQQIVQCAREARRQQTEQTLLCLTASVQPEAAAYAAGLSPPIRLIERAELLELAGHAHPATDEDLRSLGRQKRTRRSPKEWLAVVLDASRARRYLGYGVILSLFALVTRNGYYPIPAALCLLLFAACKLRTLILWRRRRWQG